MDAGRVMMRLQTEEVGSTPFRLEEDAAVEPAHGHHGQVERRHRCADRQVRISLQKLDVALIPRHFSFTLYSYTAVVDFFPVLHDTKETRGRE